MSNQSTAAVHEDARRQDVNKFTVAVNKAGIYVVVALLLLVGAVTAPGKFWTYGNAMSIIQAVSLTGICAVGLSFVVYSANFNDMSLPMTIAFSGMVSVQMLQVNFAVSIIMGILAGLLMGVINGVVIGKYRAHPVIWSMAFNFVMSGIARWAWSGNQIYPDVIAENAETAELFYQISRVRFGGIPLMVIIMAVMFAIGQFLLTRTTFGNQLKIVGSNYEVARLSGINCERSIFLTYLFNAFCASICGIILASISKTAAYYNGEGYDFATVTAVLLGGMTLAGGKGSLIGVFGGVITVGILSNIMTLMGIPTFNQWLVQGIVFLLIVWINTNSSRKLGKG